MEREFTAKDLIDMRRRAKAGAIMSADETERMIEAYMERGAMTLEIGRLRARAAELEADLEICMNALDRLADLTTMGPAIHANICEAGRNEIETRITYADGQRARTAAWQRAGREVDAEEAAARAANKEDDHAT